MKKRVPFYHQTTFDLTVFPIPQNCPFRSFFIPFSIFRAWSTSSACLINGIRLPA